MWEIVVSNILCLFYKVLREQAVQNYQFTGHYSKYNRPRTNSLQVTDKNHATQN